jgi:hypothetical protein
MGIAAASAGAAGPFRDYGPDGAADAAAESAGAAVPFGDYRPAEATQRQRWIHTYGDRGPGPWLAVGSNDPD